MVVVGLGHGQPGGRVLGLSSHAHNPNTQSHEHNEQKIPAEAEYRKVVESIASYRLKTAQEITDVRSMHLLFVSL